ncbi:MAG: hypothetical protein Q4Q04_00850 [Methanocorpusculum sp.]|nr:hypothetical protein [Methanocorpusculum sp.]
MTKKWWWAVWPFDTGKQLPRGENISTLILLGMVFLLAVGITIFFISMVNGASSPLKVVGITTEVYQGDIIRVDIISGTDVEDLVKLQLFLDGNETTPHWSNPNYAVGAVLYFRAPIGTPAGAYTAVVAGTFTDGNVQNLSISTLRLYGETVIDREVLMDVDIYIDDILRVEILGGSDLANLEEVSMYVDSRKAASHRQNTRPEEGAVLYFKTGVPLAGERHEVVVEGIFADGATAVLKKINVPLP